MTTRQGGKSAVNRANERHYYYEGFEEILQYTNFVLLTVKLKNNLENITDSKTIKGVK